MIIHAHDLNFQLNFWGPWSESEKRKFSKIIENRLKRQTRHKVYKIHEALKTGHYKNAPSIRAKIAEDAQERLMVILMEECYGLTHNCQINAL